MPTVTVTPNLPRSWHLAELAVERAARVLLYGLPGTGKTHATLTSRHPAGTVAREDIFSLTLHDDAAVSDLIGGYLPIAGKWSWRDGPAVQAWRASHDRPVRLVLNEVDRAAGPLHTALLAVMDSPASACLTLPTGETVYPCPANLQVISTMNGTPGDLDPALRDRHSAEIRCDEPHPASIAALPADLQNVAQEMTTAAARNGNRGTTPRDWHALAALMSAGIDREDAAEMVWGDRAADIAAHLAVLAVPPVTETPEEEDDAPTCDYCGSSDLDSDGDCTCSDSIRASAEASPYGEYACEEGNGRYDSRTDDDGDVWNPYRSAWENADEARDRAYDMEED